MLQSILIGLVAVLGWCEYLTGTAMIQRPIILGTLVGIILGEPVQGVIIASTIHLAFLGAAWIGGTCPVNVIAGGVISTAVAIKTGIGVEGALTLCVPIGTLYLAVDSLCYFIVQFFVPKFDEVCAKGDCKKVSLWHWVCFGTFCLMYWLVTFLTVEYGTDLVGTAFEKIPESVINGIGAGTTLLPALGFAILINSIWNRKVGVAFFIGYALAAYLGMNPVGISILAVAVGILYFTLGENQIPDFSGSSEVKQKLNRADLNKIVMRSLTMEASYTYERYQGTGFLFSIMPALQKYYENDEDGLKESLTRNVQMFQTTPAVSTICMGVACAMEEQYSQDKNSLDPSMINSVKSALMGPLAGVGDSIFWVVLPTIASGVACQLGLNGNLLAPLVFLAIYNIPHFLVRFFGMYKSYELGLNFVAKLSESNLLERVSTAATMVGLMVVGAMTVNWVYIATP